MVGDEKRRGFHRMEDGAAMVEFTVVMSLLFILVLGFVDFGYALYQWNTASKAVQVGARLAAVSNPADLTLASYTGVDTNLGIEPGDPIPFGSASDYGQRVCNGATRQCSGGTFDALAFDRVVCGSNRQCGSRGAGRPGMNDIFSRIQPENVVIEYVYSGLGFAGHPSGPVPTIRVRLQNLPFEFFFLGGLLGFGAINMPSMVSTITGEDLSTTFSN